MGGAYDSTSRVTKGDMLSPLRHQPHALWTANREVTFEIFSQDFATFVIFLDTSSVVIYMIVQLQDHI